MKWLFPIGAILNVVGLISELLLRWDVAYSFRIAKGVARVIGPTMPLSLLGGALLCVAGSIRDRKHMDKAKTRPRGNFCRSLGIISVLMMAAHNWGFDGAATFLILPVF
jgi:hypothetical protein